MTMTRVFSIAARITSLVFASSCFARAPCTLPARLDSLQIEPPRIVQPNILPVDSYVLALSWSPAYCLSARNKPEARHQCVDNAFGWVVHGLWPNSSRARRNQDQPAYCRSAAAISEATYRRYLCLMPSVKLMSHEWHKHGTCGFTTPENYFAKTESLYSAVKLPDPQAFAAPLTAGRLRQAVAGLNPGLPVAAVKVDVDRRQRLREVQICYDTRYRYASCPRPGAPDRLVIRVPPVGG